MSKNIKIYIVMIALFSITNIYSQTKRTVYRVNLNHRANVYLKDAVKEILEANCRGDITAYYPNTPDVKVEFSALANYFSIELNKIKTNSYFISNCCNNNLCNLSADKIENLVHYIEIIEDYHQTTNGVQREIKYIRLLSKMYDQDGVFLGLEKGPLYYYSEIKKTNLSIQNPSIFAKINMALVFDNHLYNDYIVSTKQTYLDYYQSEKNKKDKLKKENDIWSN